MFQRQVSAPIFYLSKDALVPQIENASGAKYAYPDNLQSTDAKTMLGEPCGDDHRKQLGMVVQSFSDISWYDSESVGMQHASQRKSKPCKGMRTRYRKLVDRLLQQIREDPRSIDFDKLDLPPSMAGNEWLKSKLLTRLMKEKSRLLMAMPAHGRRAAGISDM